MAQQKKQKTKSSKKTSNKKINKKQIVEYNKGKRVNKTPRYLQNRELS